MLSLVIWTALSLIAVKFKPLMFAVSGCALSYDANICIFMIQLRLVLLPGRGDTGLYVALFGAGRGMTRPTAPLPRGGAGTNQLNNWKESEQNKKEKENKYRKVMKEWRKERNKMKSKVAKLGARLDL